MVDVVDKQSAPDEVRDATRGILARFSREWSEVIAVLRVRDPDAVEAAGYPEWLISLNEQFEPGDLVTTDGAWAASSALTEFADGTSRTLQRVSAADRVVPSQALR